MPSGEPDSREVRKVCDVANQFDKKHIDFPVLSVFEGLETRITRHLMGRSTKVRVFLILTGTRDGKLTI